MGTPLTALMGFILANLNIMYYLLFTLYNGKINTLIPAVFGLHISKGIFDSITPLVELPPPCFEVV